MTQQAPDSLSLLDRSRPVTIEQLLRFKQKRVVNELMELFGARSLTELAIRLSLCF